MSSAMASTSPRGSRDWPSRIVSAFRTWAIAISPKKGELPVAWGQPEDTVTMQVVVALPDDLEAFCDSHPTEAAIELHASYHLSVA